jgi:hypothetical protein
MLKSASEEVMSPEGLKYVFGGFEITIKFVRTNCLLIVSNSCACPAENLQEIQPVFVKIGTQHCVINATTLLKGFKFLPSTV